MKNLKMLYIALVALVAGAFGACTTDWEPGAQPTGAQISFLSSNKTLFEFEEAVGTGTYSVTLTRVESKKLEDVYIYVETEKEYKELFEYDNIVTFNPGESTTEFNITVDQSKFVKDKHYEVKLSIADEYQKTPYGYSEWTVKFGLNPWRLIKVKNPEMEDLYLDENDESQYLKGKFRGLAAIEGIFDIVVPAEIDVRIFYHKDNVEGGQQLYKVESPWIESFTYLFGATSEEVIQSFEVADPAPGLILDCTDPDNVIITSQKFGLKDVYGVFGADEDGNTIGDLIIEGRGGFYEEGVITFPKGNIVTIDELSKSYGTTAEPLYGTTYAGNQSGLFRVVLPGCSIVDYALAGSYKGMEVASDNELVTAKFEFVYGDDVTNIKYLLVDGDVENRPDEWIEKLVDGSADNIQTVEGFVPGAGSIELKWELERGVYSVVAVPFKKDNTPYKRNVIVEPFYFASIGAQEDTSCKLEVKFGAVSKLASDVMSAEELASFPDYISLAYSIQGKDLKSISYFASETTDVEDLLKKYNNSPEELVAARGIPFSVEIVEQASTGEYVGVIGGTIDGQFNGLNPDTDHTFIVVATNIYGKSATVTRENIATGSAPEYRGDVVLGDYIMECDYEFGEKSTEHYENFFNLKNIPGKDNDFFMKNFAMEDRFEWYATYKPEDNTLVVSGMVRHYETAVEDGNMFGYNYGVWNEEKGLRYAIQAAPGVSEDEDPYGPAIFTVDPTTKQLSGLADGCKVLVVVAKGNAPQGIGRGFTSDKTTIKPYVKEDDTEGDNTTGGDDNTTGGENAGGENAGGENAGGENAGGDDATVTPDALKTSVQIPFSSVRISKGVLSNNNVKSYTSTYGKLSVNKSLSTVKPISVERCTSTNNTLRFGEVKVRRPLR